MQFFACPRVRGTPLAKIMVKSTTALMLLASHLQLSSFIQPHYDDPPLYETCFCQEQTLPWWHRVYHLMSWNPLNAPERRHASERVAQTYMLQKEPKKRT